MRLQQQQPMSQRYRFRTDFQKNVHFKLIVPISRGSASLRVRAFQTSENIGPEKQQPSLHTKVAIIGGGPAGHTAAIYAARAELEPIVFEGFMAAGIAPGGQLTTTTYVENFPGFVEPILGYELTDKFRQHSARYGTQILTETVTNVDLLVHDTFKPPGLYRGLPSRSMEDTDLGAPKPLAHAEEVQRPRRPFKLWTPSRCITADTIIIATGASARRLSFPGSGDESEGGFWNRGISACAICDGTSPLIRNKPVAVVGGGDSAMEEAMFLTRYASKVYIVHRFDYLEASKAMARRALANPKIEIKWCSQVVEAHGNDQGNLGSITIARSPVDAHKSAPVGLSGTVPPPPPSALIRERLDVGGLFFAIGHRPATDFLQGQLDLDEYGYIVTVPGSTVTSVPGVFAAGDVMDRSFRQAITAAGRGCMAALEAERFLHALHAAADVIGAATEQRQNGQGVAAKGSSAGEMAAAAEV